MPDFFGSERTVVNVMRCQARTAPDRVWLTNDERCFTVGEMDERSTLLARSLQRTGIEAGELVLVLLPNCIEFIDAWLAIAKLRAVQIPVNTAYYGAMLHHIVKDSGARRIFTHVDYLRPLLEVMKSLPGQLTTIVMVGEPVDIELTREFHAQSSVLLSYDDLLNPSDSGAILPPPEHHDVAAIMYTSGTTGASKGVMVTHAHAYQYAAGDNALQLGPEDVYYAPLPLFHIAGQWAVVYNCLIRGARAVIKPKFSIGEFWGDVTSHGITTTFMLGAMGSLLFRTTEGQKRTTLAKVLMSPLIPEYREFCEKFGVKVSTAYASTEVNGVLGTDLDPPNHLTCGKARADKFEVKLVDEWDEEVPVGEVGELVVRPKMPWIVMLGYWRRPSETNTAWRNLWLHSGDLLKRDADGYYYFVDRLKDSIRRRGENISSVEVENVINSLPQVLESAVVPVASEHTEQEVLAYVVLREGVVTSERDLHVQLSANLPKFMVPRYIQFIEGIPKTTTGKPQKYKLRSEADVSTLWDADAQRARKAGAV